MRINYIPSMIAPPPGGEITVSKVIKYLIRTPVYAGIYNWGTATDPRGIAPANWHLATVEDYNAMRDNLGGASVAGGALKETGTEHWLSPNTGATNSSGFNARGSGFRRYNGLFVNLLSSTYFALYFSTFPNSPYQFSVFYDNANTGFGAGTVNNGYQIRLVKNDSTWNEGDTMTDFDGNVYPTVKIGNEVWMATSLIVEHFNNGDPIPYIGGDTAWGNLTSEGMSYYSNLRSNGYAEAQGEPISDTSIFSVTATGQRAVNPIISQKQVSQATPAVFPNLPYDTYVITEDAKEGYNLSSIEPGEVILETGNVSDTVEIVNTLFPVPGRIKLTFDDIANAVTLFGGVITVQTTNEYFELPAYGCAFSAVEISGNTVELIGGWGITLRDNLFSFNLHLIAFEDVSGCVTVAGKYVFKGCTAATLLHLAALQYAGEACFKDCAAAIITCPNLIWAGLLCFADCTMNIFDFLYLETAGVACFQDCQLTTVFNLPVAKSIGQFGFARCYDAITFNLSSMVALGETVVGNYVFYEVYDQTITLTIPAALMTCNGGNPDADITYLQANNTVTVIVSD